MTKVVADMSMSLDGYVRAPNARPDEPLGDGGERLHEWAFGRDEQDRRVLADAGQMTGAVIAGRRTYDDSVPFWGPDGPTGQARLPVFVVTHQPPAESPERGVYEFVTGGIEAALDQARAAAGDRSVCVMGGAWTVQEYLNAGLVDEVSVHLVPVLFGGGLRLFDDLGARTDLEPIESVSTPAATHLRFRVVK
jgi:dihydrofolate reductase